MAKKKLTADGLKNALWETLNEVKDGDADPREAHAVASTSREIMSVVKTQLSINRVTGKRVNKKLADFADGK